MSKVKCPLELIQHFVFCIFKTAGYNYSSVPNGFALTLSCLPKQSNFQ